MIILLVTPGMLIDIIIDWWHWLSICSIAGARSQLCYDELSRGLSFAGVDVSLQKDENDNPCARWDDRVNIAIYPWSLSKILRSIFDVDGTYKHNYCRWVIWHYIQNIAFFCVLLDTYYSKIIAYPPQIHSIYISCMFVHTVIRQIWLGIDRGASYKLVLIALNVLMLPGVTALSRLVKVRVFNSGYEKV